MFDWRSLVAMMSCIGRTSCFELLLGFAEYEDRCRFCVLQQSVCYLSARGFVQWFRVLSVPYGICLSHRFGFLSIYFYALYILIASYPLA